MIDALRLRRLRVWSIAGLWAAGCGGGATTAPAPVPASQAPAPVIDPVPEPEPPTAEPATTPAWTSISCRMSQSFNNELAEVTRGDGVEVRIGAGTAVFPDAGAWPGLADARAVSAMFHAYECTVAGSLLACEREPEGGTVVSAGERDSLAVVPAQSVALTVDVVSAQDTFVVALELVTVGANDQRAGAALRFRPGDCFVKGPTANAVDPDQPDQTRAR